MEGWKQEVGEQPKIGMVGGGERKQKVKGRAGSGEVGNLLLMSKKLSS